MIIFFQLSQQLQYLSKLLAAINYEQYTQKIEHLGNSTIGSHTRHIIELLQCAINGYRMAEIDYINRCRNLQLETDMMLAQSTIQQIQNEVNKTDKQLRLVVDKLEDESEPLPVITTYFREILYNSEHIIHHLALIKVAIIEMKLPIVEEHFGMAYSTIHYKASLQ